MIITDEQRIELGNNPRFQEVAKQFVRNYAIFITGNNGDATPGGMPKVDWARRRTIGAGIELHPNSQDYAEWVSQFMMLLKGQDVWDTDVDVTISAMIASGKFDELAETTYGIRMQKIEF